MRATLACASLLFTACADKVIDLGQSPLVDAAAPPVDASWCRCRITPCRTSEDCRLIGGACGADEYCVGDFGACGSNSACQATFAGSQCTSGTASTEPCGQ